MGTTRLATTSNWLHITKQSWKIPPSRTEDALLSMGLNTNSPNLWPTTVEFIFTYLHTTMTIFPHRAIQGFSLSTISSPFLTMLDRYTSDCMKSIHSIRNNIKEHTPLKMKLPVKYSYLIRNYEHSLLPICTQWPLSLLTGNFKHSFPHDKQLLLLTNIGQVYRWVQTINAKY